MFFNRISEFPCRKSATSLTARAFRARPARSNTLSGGGGGAIANPNREILLVLKTEIGEGLAKLLNEGNCVDPEKAKNILVLSAGESIDNAASLLINGNILHRETAPEVFLFAVSIADYRCVYGGEEDAIKIFSGVRFSIDRLLEPEKRDEIRKEAVAVCKRRGFLEMAARFASDIDSTEEQFDLLLGIADLMAKAKDAVAAKNLLLIKCASTARNSEQSKLEKAVKLIKIATALQQIGDDLWPENLFEEAAKHLSPTSDAEFKMMEDIAVHLIRLGSKEKALALLGKKWGINPLDGSDQTKARRLALIMDKCPRVAVLLKS